MLHRPAAGLKLQRSKVLQAGGVRKLSAVSGMRSSGCCAAYRRQPAVAGAVYSRKDLHSSSSSWQSDSRAAVCPQDLCC